MISFQTFLKFSANALNPEQSKRAQYYV